MDDEKAVFGINLYVLKKLAGDGECPVQFEAGSIDVEMKKSALKILDQDAFPMDSTAARVNEILDGWVKKLSDGQDNALFQCAHKYCQNDDSIEYKK